MLEDILEEKSFFNEEELRKSKELCAEEEMLRKEIHELETTEIEVIRSTVWLLELFIFMTYFSTVVQFTSCVFFPVNLSSLTLHFQQVL